MWTDEEDELKWAGTAEPGSGSAQIYLGNARDAVANSPLLGLPFPCFRMALLQQAFVCSDFSNNIYYYANAALDGLTSPTKTLQASGDVYCLLALPDGQGVAPYRALKGKAL